jgi:hypothetical protein
VNYCLNGLTIDVLTLNMDDRKIPDTTGGTA